MEEYKQKLKERIGHIIRQLNTINRFENNNGINNIIKKYDKVFKMLDSEIQPINNPIKGSVRAYLDIFSDYENPLLAKMYDVEKEIDLYLSECKKETSKNEENFLDGGDLQSPTNEHIDL